MGVVGEGRFPTPPSNFLTPAAYPRSQLNSDTIYLECKIAADSTGEGFSPTRLPPPPELQTPGTSLSYLLCALTDQLWFGGSNDPSLVLTNLLQKVTELREMFYLLDY